jgi:hypothetical protein
VFNSDSVYIEGEEILSTGSGSAQLSTHREVKSLSRGSVNSVFMECETSLRSERAQPYSLGARPVSVAGVLNPLRIPGGETSSSGGCAQLSTFTWGARPVSVAGVLNSVRISSTVLSRLPIRGSSSISCIRGEHLKNRIFIKWQRVRTATYQVQVPYRRHF